MKTRTRLPFVPSAPGFKGFSLRGGAAIAVLASALAAGACIPQDSDIGRPASTTGPGVVVPPLPSPAAPPAAPPGIDPSAPPAPPPESNTVTLVVGDEDELSAGDEELSDILEDLGFRVRELDDGEDSDEAEDSGLVVISGSVSPGTVEDEYRNLDVPVVVLDSNVLADMGMTTDGRDESGQTSDEEVEIALGSHPIASGLDGTVEVVDQRSQLQWGIPAAGAQVIARIAGEPDQAAIFVYDRGAQMASGKAPHRRVGFFAGDAAAADLSNDGERLFENAVLWAWSGQTSIRPD